MKQGLLSLDPEVQLDKSIEPQSNFENENFNPMDANSQAQALGDIARPGSYIQFFVAQEPGPKSSGFLRKLLKDKSESNADAETVNSLTIGCIPSRVDEMPVQMTGPGGQSLKPVEESVLDFRYGHFGAQSESGMFMSSSGPNRPDIKTKIDVPYTNLSLIS